MLTHNFAFFLSIFCSVFGGSYFCSPDRLGMDMTVTAPLDMGTGQQRYVVAYTLKQGIEKQPDILNAQKSMSNLERFQSQRISIVLHEFHSILVSPLVRRTQVQIVHIHLNQLKRQQHLPFYGQMHCFYRNQIIVPMPIS